jgi:hypothetical protein
MTLWEAWPVATPSVRVEPEIVQVNQFALGLEQEVALSGLCRFRLVHQRLQRLGFSLI